MKFNCNPRHCRRLPDIPSDKKKQSEVGGCQLYSTLSDCYSDQVVNNKISNHYNSISKNLLTNPFYKLKNKLKSSKVNEKLGTIFKNKKNLSEIIQFSKNKFDLNDNEINYNEYHYPVKRENMALFPSTSSKRFPNGCGESPNNNKELKNSKNFLLKKSFTMYHSKMNVMNRSSFIFTDTSAKSTIPVFKKTHRRLKSDNGMSYYEEERRGAKANNKSGYYNRPSYQHLYMTVPSNYKNNKLASTSLLLNNIPPTPPPLPPYPFRCLQEHSFLPPSSSAGRVKNIRLPLTRSQQTTLSKYPEQPTGVELNEFNNNHHYGSMNGMVLIHSTETSEISNVAPVVMDASTGMNINDVAPASEAPTLTLTSNLFIPDDSSYDILDGTIRAAEAEIPLPISSNSSSDQFVPLYSIPYPSSLTSDRNKEMYYTELFTRLPLSKLLYQINKVPANGHTNNNSCNSSFPNLSLYALHRYYSLGSNSDLIVTASTTNLISESAGISNPFANQYALSEADLIINPNYGMSGLPNNNEAHISITTQAAITSTDETIRNNLNLFPSPSFYDRDDYEPMFPHYSLPYHMPTVDRSLQFDINEQSQFNTANITGNYMDSTHNESAIYSIPHLSSFANKKINDGAHTCLQSPIYANSFLRGQRMTNCPLPYLSNILLNNSLYLLNESVDNNFERSHLPDLTRGLQNKLIDKNITYMDYDQQNQLAYTFPMKENSNVYERVKVNEYNDSSINYYLKSPNNSLPRDPVYQEIGVKL